MELKRLMLVVLVVIVVIASSVFLLNYDDAIEYETVNLSSSCMIDVPSGDDFTNSTVNEAIHLMNDTNRDLTIYYYNSEDNNTVARVEFEFIINDFKTNATEQTISNQTVWYNEENETYLAFLGNPDTHDNIIICCKDIEILEDMISSIKYIITNEDNSTIEVDANNNTLNTTSDSNTSDSYSVSSNSTVSSDSSGTTSDGYYWSGQDQDYIKEYTDENGVQHIDRKNGVSESYDPNTNKHYTNGVEDTDAYNQDFN